MQQLPEEIRGMVVCMSGGSGTDTRIEADEDTNQIRAERIDKVVDKVGVFAGRSVSRRRVFDFFGGSL